jgi:hypothetical protein
MKELFNLLSLKERRTAAVVGAVLGAGVLLLLFMALREHRAATRAAAELQATEQAYQTLSRTRNEVKKEWQGWMDAQKDMASLRTGNFFDGKKITQDLRLTLQQLFDEAGIPVTDIAYGYTEFVKESIEKVAVDFRFSGNYAMLKRLLDAVERHPRFLHVEKIDFQGFGKQPGLLDIKISLAGYYEN